MSSENILEINDATVGYAGCSVVSNINFSIPRGEVTALIGENGSGKSTILKTIVKEIPLISGTIKTGGRDISKLSAQEISRSMAIVMTGSIRPEYFTCYDMVSSGRYPYTDMLGRLKDEDKKAVEEAMRLVGTWGMKDRFVTDISDGQRQLVMLSRAIAQEPELLILDEPTSFLDIRHRSLFAKAVGRLVKDKNISVLMSIHELDLVRSMADRIIALKDGHIDNDGRTTDILTDTYIRELFRLDEEEAG